MTYVLLDSDDRVISISDICRDEENEIEVTLPDDFETRPFKKCFYKDGQIVYDNTIYILVDDSGRIVSVSDFHIDEAREIEIEFANQFDPSNYENYIYQDGEFIYSEKPIPVYEQIALLKSNLEETDYVVAKLAEAQVTGRSIPEEDSDRYAEILIRRQEWRAQINELEGETNQ